MPDFSSHIEKSNRNKRVSNYCEAADEKYYDWSIAAQFYTAVHMVEAVFAKQVGLHNKSHVDRKIAMKGSPALFSKSLCRNYFVLEGLSKTARYDVALMGKQDSDKAKGCVEYIESELSELITK